MYRYTHTGFFFLLLHPNQLHWLPAIEGCAIVRIQTCDLVIWENAFFPCSFFLLILDVCVWTNLCMSVCLGLVGPDLRGLWVIQSFKQSRVRSGSVRYRSSSSRSASSQCTRVSGAKAICSLISNGANFPQTDARV